MKSGNKKPIFFAGMKKAMIVGEIFSTPAIASDFEPKKLDHSKIKLSFLENDEELEWKTTSKSKQDKLAIKAYSEFAY